MGNHNAGSITVLLDAAGKGDSAASDQLWAILSEELHQMAHRRLAAEPAACDRQTTSLVNEAFIRLVGNQPIQFGNRRHFFGSASRVMRQILVDDARKRRRPKHGGGEQIISLKYDPIGPCRDPDEVLAVHEALEKLATMDARKAQIVEMHYFAGLTGEEIAELLELSPRTVDSELQFARAWLHRELSKGDDSDSPIDGR